MDGTPWRVKLTAKPIMVAMMAWNREGEGGGGLVRPLDPETAEGDGALTHGPRGIVTGGGVFHSNSNFK
jgi:hypothetical protein